MSFLIPSFPLSIRAWGGEGCAPFVLAYQIDFAVRTIVFLADVKDYRENERSWLRIILTAVYTVYDLVTDIGTLTSGNQMTCGFTTGLVLLLILSLGFDCICLYTAYIQKTGDSGGSENTITSSATAVLGHGGQPIARF